jgi:hypothetical protein
MQRRKLFLPIHVERSTYIIKDLKVARSEIGICDNCCNPLGERLVSHGTSVVCSVECGYEISNNEPHVERKSLLERQKEEQRELERKEAIEANDIYVKD